MGIQPLAIGGAQVRASQEAFQIVSDEVVDAELARDELVDHGFAVRVASAAITLADQTDKISVNVERVALGRSSIAWSVERNALGNVLFGACVQGQRVDAR